jgi:hypothetical protein
MSFGGQTPTIIVLKEGRLLSFHKLEAPLLTAQQVPTLPKAKGKLFRTSMLA